MFLLKLKSNEDTSPDLKALAELFKDDKPSEELPVLLKNLKSTIQSTQTDKPSRKP
jgi:hypothetical protein